MFIGVWGLLTALPAQAQPRPTPALLSSHEWEKPTATPAPTPVPSPSPAGLLPQKLPAPSQVITVDVPILMYHHVGAPYRNQFNVPLSDFKAQMDYLAQNGYTTVSMAQIAAALRGQSELPPCPVAITFDDGYADVYHNALPVLRKHGFHATFYVVTGYISATKTFMNWDQLKHLSSLGMEIGSHSYNHPFLAQTTGYTLTRQIVGSKSRLEAGVGISITTFAYPYGSYNGSVAALVAEAGYTSAAAASGTFQQTSQRIYAMSRLAVYDNISLPVFIARLPKHGPKGLGPCPLPPAAAQSARPVKSDEEAP